MKTAMILATILGVFSGAAWADEAGAKRELDRYNASLKGYSAAIEQAQDAKARINAAELKPNAGTYALRIYRELNGSIDKPWIVPYMEWIFQNASSIDRKRIDGLRKVFKDYHLRSEGAGKVVYGLVNVPDPESLSLAEEVLEKHPDKREQGVAALAISEMIANFGDGAPIMERRLAMLRKAIIDSAEVQVAGRTVGDIARDNLFVMTNLTKGRVAPNLKEMGIDGREIDLASFRGKTVILIFWSSFEAFQGPDAMAWMKKTAEEMAGADLALIGVNMNQPKVLQKLVVDGEVTWPNISNPGGELANLYRITQLPVAYVLDKEGVIHYKGVPGAFVSLAAEALVGEGKEK